MAIQMSRSPPTICSSGTCSSTVTIATNTSRRRTAPTVPQIRPIIACRGGSVRTARAITTALSPESARLISTMPTQRAQNSGSVRNDTAFASDGRGTLTRGPRHRRRSIRFCQCLVACAPAPGPSVSKRQGNQRNEHDGHVARRPMPMRLAHERLKPVGCCPRPSWRPSSAPCGSLVGFGSATPMATGRKVVPPKRRRSHG